MPPKKVTPRGQSAPPPSVQDSAPTTKPARKPRAKKAARPDEERRYIRNIRHIPCRLTLENGRTINLQPRGQRDDAAVIQPEEIDDARLLDNHGWLFQYVSYDEYLDTISKQSHNANVPTLVDQLRDEYGNPMTNKGIAIPFEQQGVVVARTEEAAPRTVYQETGEQLRRTGPVGPQQVQVPGSVGHPLSIPNEQQRANRQVNQREQNLLPDVDQLRQNLR